MKESESEVLKIEESESELLCTDSTALPVHTMKGIWEWKYGGDPFLTQALDVGE
jgi:hypothetical protein